MQRVILHIDLDNFFASVECALNPAIAGEPVAVCGDADARHGIVLAKNQLAKRAGIKTGQTIAEAKSRAPGLVVVTADYEHYLAYSTRARRIYESYTPRVEPFGLDECWLDVSSRYLDLAGGERIAREIRARIFEELHITASVGISFNKIFAKLGSDYNKPNGIKVFSEENFRQDIWPLGVRELLYCGRATEEKLQKRNINTIGALARSDPAFLRTFLGKPGVMLWNYANGYESAPVNYIGEGHEIKSIGNSTTTYRDLRSMTDVKSVIYLLTEKVARRMRQKKLTGACVHLSVRYADLSRFEIQHRLSYDTDLDGDMAREVLKLFEQEKCLYAPIRSLGVRMSELKSTQCAQLTFFDNTRRRRLEETIDALHERFGNKRPVRAVMLCDEKLLGFEENRRQVFSAVDNSEQTQFAV